VPHDLVEDLRKEIAKGRVLAIVGAGVSIGATKNASTASWTGLLENGVDRCVAVAQPLPAGWADRVRAEIHSGDMDDLLSAAEKISSKLGFPKGGNYRTWLREAVGTLHAKELSVLEALRDLGIPLATTNYDGLLEEVTDLPAVTWREGAKVERVIRGDGKGILHIHGYWDEPESVIMGTTSYEGIRRDAHAQNVLRTLRTVQTLLFIGCGEGLSDPNMGGLLQWSREIFAGSEYPHYRLCRDSEAPDLRNRHPQEERIVVLPYGPHHSDLASFLQSLSPSIVSEPEKKKEKEPLSEKRAPRLPPAPRCFGRADQVEDLVATLCAHPPPPTPILGPPGVGKTTITLTALHDHRVVEKYGARRYFVRCDGAKSRDALVGEIITALGVEAGPNLEELVFLDLERAPAVLALDNAETPWEADTVAVEDFLTQLTAIPGLALVASLRGEQRPFGPTWREAIRVVPLDLDSARTTFLAVAGEKYRSDPNLNRLLEAVDRLPLAVTLLAYQAEGLSDLSGVWKRWQDKRTAILRRGDGKERLSNLGVSLELSIQGPRMTEPARRLLSLLGVLPDGIASEDLNAVLPEEGENAAVTLRKVGFAIAGDTRLRVLAPVREHAGSQHPPEPEDLSLVINYYLNLAELGERAGAEGGKEAIERLTPETGNLESIVLRGLSGADPVPSIYAVRALSEFDGLTRLDIIGLLKRARDVARQIEEEELEADCLYGLGRLALRGSEHDEARERFQEALPLYQHVGSLLGQANCIKGLGDIAKRRSDHDAARVKLQEALILYQRVGSLLGQANCIKGIGDIAIRQLDYTAARVKLQEALILYERLSDLLGQANCIHELGFIALRCSEHDAAREKFREALTLHQRGGSLLGQANCIQGIGDIAFRRSEHDAAREKFQEAVDLYEKVSDPYSIGWARVRLARIASTSEEKQQHVQAAREAWTRIKQPDLVEWLDKEFSRS
jgi:tetratricopeptide (TPR) repeat protein